MKRSVSILLLIFIIQFFLSGQTVHKWREDGVVIFQLKTSVQDELPKINKEEVDIHQVWFLQPLIKKYDISRCVQLHPGIRDENLIRTYRLEFQQIWLVDQLIEELQSIDVLEYVEPMPWFEMLLVPNDQYYSQQWHLSKIKAAQAWDISTGSSAIKVAITDDAFVTTHPDLTNKLLPGRDVADGDNNVNPGGANDGAHGTHVAGIAGAQTNNSIGVASIGFNTSIIPVKIARDSDGTLVAGYTGITWAADNGAHVINMSWGSEQGGTYGQNVINYAWNKGCILVAAAGNDNVETMFYPAAYNNVIAVAATNSSDQKASFSQYGTWIDVSSPGVNILSTFPSTSYNNMSGTSMASPLVAGLVGLMWSVNPSASQNAVVNCLLTSTDDISAQNPQYVGKLGTGRINAQKALQCMQSGSIAYDAGIVSIVQPNGTVCGGSISPIVTLKNFGTNNLTSVNIRYQVDAGTIQSYSWAGNLVTGQTINVTLPSISFSSGGHTFKAYTQNPNGQADQNPSNDQTQVSFTSFTGGVSLPFSETFESGSFATNNWTVINPDGGITWEIATIAGTTPGNKAAKMNFYDYTVIGQRDALISPPINLSGYQNASLTFQHAYRRYNTSSTDSLIIYVSANCGQTYQRVLALGENGTGIFATGSTTTSAFTPASTNDWCNGSVGASCKTVDLTPFVGQSNVIIKFETYNNYGNNLYIDNINVTGTVLNTPPTIQISASATSICVGQSVTFTDQSYPSVTSRQWTFQGGTPSTSTNQVQTVTYNTAGSWSVTLSATNAAGTNQQTFPNYIQVYPLPPQRNIIQNGSQLSVQLNSGETIQWYRNGNIIPGATSAVYQVTQVGNYKAKITNQNDCFIFTNEVYINPTGVDEYAFDIKQLMVYPNPASDLIYVFLSSPVLKNIDIFLCDITGKIIHRHTIEAGDDKTRISVAHLPEGIYIIRLNEKTFVNPVRLMIMRE